MDAATVWRDFNTDGVPASGLHKPVLSEIREWGTDLELFRGPSVATRAELKAIDTTLLICVVLTESGREGIFVWRTGNFAALVAADTAEGIYIKADAIATSAGAWVRQNNGKWNATWFGLDTAGTGAANVTALAAAFNLAKGLVGAVHIPSGSYTMASLITIAMANNDKLHVTGDGYAASIMAWPGTSGIQINMIAGPWWLMSAGAPGNAVTFDGIGFVTDGDGVANTAAGVALAVNGNNSAGRPPPAFVIQNCSFRSSVASSCWSRGMILTSVSSVVIDKCQWYGCSNQRDIGIFILLGATATHDSSPYHISNCEAYFFSAAIQAGAYIEGIHVSHCDLVGGIYGIVWDASASGGESQLCAVGVHTNTTVRGIWTTNVQHSQISDCLLFITAAAGTAIDIVDGSSLTIHGNVISCGSLATTSGIVFRSSVFTSTNYLGRASSVSGNTIENATIGINLDANTRNITVSNDNAYQGCTTNFGDQSNGGNDTGRVLSKNTGTVGTTAVTTVETLMSYTIPANRVATGKTVKLYAYGKTAANANSKTILMYVGATQIGGTVNTANNLSWVLEADVDITGSSAEEFLLKSTVSGSGTVVQRGTAAEAIAAGLAVSLRGQNGTASANDIVCEYFRVEVI